MQTDGGKLHFEDCPTMAQQTNKWNSLKMQTVILHGGIYGPLSRRLDRCDHVIQNESRDPFGGNVYYVTMQITFLTRKFRNGERILHCDVAHITIIVPGSSTNVVYRADDRNDEHDDMMH